MEVELRDGVPDEHPRLMVRVVLDGLAALRELRGDDIAELAQVASLVRLGQGFALLAGLAADLPGFVLMPPEGRPQPGLPVPGEERQKHGGGQQSRVEEHHRGGEKRRDDFRDAVQVHG
ncbi:MAG: hypothetical protein ACOZEN_03885 [Thermodesulfobacteriota bacterium]